jgi:hypothetical protein
MNAFNSSSQDAHGYVSHLTEAQFTDYLIGIEPLPAATQHLSRCAACRDELAAFGVTVDSFNQTSAAWSESAWDESRMSTRLREKVHVRASRPVLNAAAWALATCTLLMTGTSILLQRQNAEIRPAAIASEGASQDESDAQIAQDNRLLMEVDRELRTEVRSPALEYGIGPSRHTRVRPDGQTRIQ